MPSISLCLSLHPVNSSQMSVAFPLPHPAHRMYSSSDTSPFCLFFVTDKMALGVTYHLGRPSACGRQEMSLGSLHSWWLWMMTVLTYTHCYTLGQDKMVTYSRDSCHLHVASWLFLDVRIVSRIAVSLIAFSIFWEIKLSAGQARIYLMFSM